MSGAGTPKSYTIKVRDSWREDGLNMKPVHLTLSELPDHLQTDSGQHLTPVHDLRESLRRFLNQPMILM